MRGIYQITCTRTGKRYIGSSVDIPKRWTSHFWHLRRNRHHNIHLQRAYNKSQVTGWVFRLDVLQEVPYGTPEHLIELEAQFIERLKPEFNLVRDPRLPPMAGRTHTEKTKRKIRESNLATARQKDQ